MIADPRRIIDRHAGDDFGDHRTVTFVDGTRKIVHRHELNFWAFATTVIVLLALVEIIDRMLG